MPGSRPWCVVKDAQHGCTSDRRSMRAVRKRRTSGKHRTRFEPNVSKSELPQGGGWEIKSHRMSLRRAETSAEAPQAGQLDMLEGWGERPCGCVARVGVKNEGGQDLYESRTFCGPRVQPGNMGSPETIAGEARRGLWLGRTWNRASSIQSHGPAPRLSVR